MPTYVTEWWIISYKCRCMTWAQASDSGVSSCSGSQSSQLLWTFLIARKYFGSLEALHTRLRQGSSYWELKFNVKLALFQRREQIKKINHQCIKVKFVKHISAELKGWETNFMPLWEILHLYHSYVSSSESRIRTSHRFLPHQRDTTLHHKKQFMYCVNVGFPLISNWNPVADPRWWRQ